MFSLRSLWNKNQDLVTKIPSRPLSLAYHVHKPSHHEIKAPPLVILHGLFGSKQNNRSISKLLAADLNAEVYALDLRNHGQSPHAKTHDYLSMAADVEEFLRIHNLQSAALIGHSMGAKTAMAVALRSPQLLRALVPVDNAPVDVRLSSDFYKYTQGMREIEDARVQKQAEADKILQQYEPSLAIRQFILTNLERPAPGGPLQFRIPLEILGAALGQMGDFPFKDPINERFEGPTLFIRGTKSKYIPDDVIPAIGQFFPRFSLQNIEAGHWVISENPQAFRVAVREFISGVDSQD